MKHNLKRPVGCSGALMITIAVFILLIIVNSFVDIPNKKNEQEIITETIEVKEELSLPVIVGNYAYYVPEGSEIEYEEIMTTVNCSDYGVKSFHATGAPQTADAVIELYGAVTMQPYENDNDIEGVLLQGTYEETTLIKTFCFTIDDVFHSIEVWMGPDTNESVADDLFNTVCFVDQEKLAKELLEKEQIKAFNESMKEEYERAMREASELYEDDDYSDYARGYYSRGRK